MTVAAGDFKTRVDQDAAAAWLAQVRADLHAAGRSGSPYAGMSDTDIALCAGAGFHTAARGTHLDLADGGWALAP
jgi:hypothetical protein